MNRRGFLASLLGLAAAPIAGVLPAKLPTKLWSVKDWNDAWIARIPPINLPPPMKYWYDKHTRTIKFRHYTPYEIYNYKAPGTSS